MKVSGQDVRTFCNDILLKMGTSKADAATVADHLADADLSGVRSHGLLRMIKYVEQIDRGYIANKEKIEIKQLTKNVLRVDANKNFGIVGFHQLMPRLKELTREYGLAAAAMVNCAHTGRIGAYSEIMAREFMWSMVFGGGGHEKLQEVAPYGGSKGVFDTNPYSFSLPLDSERVVTSDFATSATAQGKLLVYRTNETAVPEGWLLDKSGKPTTRAKDFYEGGVLLPAGGVKGYGMGFVAEMFGDALLGQPHELNWFIVAMDLSLFNSQKDYFSAASHLRAKIESCPPLEKVEKVMWPGQPEHEARERQGENGIEYSVEELASLAGLEKRFAIKLVS